MPSVSGEGHLPVCSYACLTQGPAGRQFFIRSHTHGGMQSGGGVPASKAADASPASTTAGDASTVPAPHMGGEASAFKALLARPSIVACVHARSGPWLLEASDAATAKPWSLEASDAVIAPPSSSVRPSELHAAVTAKHSARLLNLWA